MLQYDTQVLKSALPWLFPIEGNPDWTLIFGVSAVVYLGTWFSTRVGVRSLAQANARGFCKLCQLAGSVTFFAVLMGWPVGFVLSHGVRVVSPDLIDLIRWFFLVPAILVVIQYAVVGVGLIVASHSLNSGIDDEMDSLWMQYQFLSYRQLATFVVSLMISIFLVDVLRRS